MKNYKIKIYFLSAPRFGKQGVKELSAYNYLGADTLFNAISLAYLDLYGKEKLESFLSLMLDSKSIPFYLSSFYPNGAIPAPIINPYSLAEDTGVGKKDRTDFIGYNALQKIQNHQSLSKSDYIKPLDLNDKAVASLCNPGDGEFYENAVPYHVTTINPNNENIVLSGFMNITDAYLTNIKTCFAYLQDEGLGGNRSSGMGHIQKITIEPNSELSSHKGNYHLLLNDLYPSSDDLLKLKNSQNSYYKIENKAGWYMNSDKRKPNTSYFKAGSIFDFKPEGTLLDVSREDHKSFRYGLAYTTNI